MNICSTFSHLAQGREEILSHVSSLTQLESNETYTYKLNHHYDAAPSDVYVRTNIAAPVFELLLANILFAASEIEECYDLGQEEIAASILQGLYGVNVLNDAAATDQHFDLYYVWEKWCSKYDAVMKLNVLQHEKLHDELVKIIPEDF